MSDEASGRQMRFPPDYVPFLDVPKWISHRFGTQLPDGWDQELFSQIRTSDPTVGYRVRGITADTGLNMRMAPPGPNRLNAPWLILARSGEVIVDSWDEADFDPTNFTVAGPRLPDGSQARHPIEVRWTDVERWARSQGLARAGTTTSRQEPDADQTKSAVHYSVAPDIPSLLPAELSGDRRTCSAFIAMYQFADEVRKTKGVPAKRDALVHAARASVSKFSVREARHIFQYLPDDLRNTTRTSRS